MKFVSKFETSQAICPGYSLMQTRKTKMTNFFWWRYAGNYYHST